MEVVMLESEKFAIAARLHVVLRRKVGRITDVEWMVRNRDYAVEIIRVSREQHDEEIRELADKCEVVFAPRPASERASRSVSMPPSLADARPGSPVAARNPLAGQVVSRYVGGLR
jgi:hypothetical protein